MKDKMVAWSDDRRAVTVAFEFEQSVRAAAMLFNTYQFRYPDRTVIFQVLTSIPVSKSVQVHLFRTTIVWCTLRELK
jgi:hypothetical protein